MEIKKKYLVILGTGILVLLVSGLFLFGNSEENKCSWSNYPEHYEENELTFCCKLQVNEDGEYGFYQDGKRILNKCEAREK